jgi:signal transduction histidine kinase
LLVGILCTTLQDRAKRVARLAVRDARARREALLAAAGDRIRETLSSELVVRAVVREALPVLHARAARFYPNGVGDVVAAPFGGGAGAIDEPTPPEIASVTRRAIDDERILVFTGTDAVARLLLDRLQAPTALAIPVRDRAQIFGVLLVSGDFVADEDLLATARLYAGIAETAMAQARLFDELAQRNEELAERQEVIRDLVYALSHDLRTPLAALSVTLRQARDGGYGDFPPEYRDVLAASLVSIDDLRRLAETLLLVARIEAGEHRAQAEAVDLRALAQDVVAEFEAMAQSRGITLSIDGPAGFALADRADLRRAIVNLVANSLQYTAKNGTVVLRSRREAGRVQLEVLDDGFGVAEEHVPFLFQRFSGGRAGSGSGLGLYLVRRVAEHHGGAVHYTRREPRGSIFTIDLPQCAAFS